MAFDPRQFWQITILEVLGIATVVVSTVVLAGVLYSVW
ncbi:hypothetical protein ABIB81_003087 [Bradyrhizobium sp. I1.7.5]